MTKEQLIAALMAFYGDTSRSREETKEVLQDVAAQIEMLIESLDD